ncbi:MAG TPA: hypothetical protein VHY08_17310 [Bacillota bacterium]|nr:hypothetical protein [Bacillota bacterium]
MNQKGKTLIEDVDADFGDDTLCKNFTSIRLMDNDLLLLKYLLESNFLTREQVQKYIYSGYSEQYLNSRRFWKLCRGKFIKKGPMVDQNRTVLLADEMALIGVSVYRERLENLCRERRLFYVTPDLYLLQPRIDLRQFTHDYYLNQVRFEFENRGADFWISDKLLYRTRKFKKIPDGVFQKEQRIFAVELETTLKKPGRYKDSFSLYCSTPEIDFVLYIAGNNRIYRDLARMITPGFIDDSPEAFKKFMLIRLDDFLKGGLVFQNHAYNDFELDLDAILKK